MPKVVFISPGGGRTALDVAAGTTLMRAAVDADLRGIVAECGGSRMCATCHVYVDEPFRSRLAPMAPEEDEMLAAVAAERRPGSRLSCQIAVGDELDGLEVTIPDRQY